MKNKKINLIISAFIVIILISAIAIIIIKSYFGTSKAIRSAYNFLDDLVDVEAISKNELLDRDTFKELMVSNEINSMVKYKVVGNTFGMDLDEDYEVIGFTDTNTYIEKNSKIISENKAIEKAEQYLDKIIKDKFKFREIKEESEENLPYYTISFYKYHKNYLCLDYEILLNINKYNGKLIGYYGVNDQEIKYNNECDVKIDKAKKIAQNYFDKLKIQGDFTNNNMIGYINIGEDKSELAYLLRYEAKYNDKKDIYDIYVSAKDGEIIKENINLEAINLN